jgi:hypothetical protein
MNKQKVFEILKDQIIKSFSEANIIKEDCIGIRINDYELTVNQKLEIVCTFQPIKNVPIDLLRLYFKDRLSFPFTETYVDVDRIRIFRRDFRRNLNEKKQMTSIVYAMEAYSHFKEVYDSYQKFIQFNS